jgi:hypothetical protein
MRDRELRRERNIGAMCRQRSGKLGLFICKGALRYFASAPGHF